MTAAVADLSTAGKNRASMDDDDPPVLFPRHVAALWSEIAEQPIDVDTVKRYVRDSFRPGGRWHDLGDPVPTPLYEGLRPYGLPAQAGDLAEWFRRQRGRIGDPRSVGDRDAHGRRT